MTQTITVSRLGHTWLIDLDGTVLAHNGHLEGGDRVLPGVEAFWAQIPEGDVIVLLSAREDAHLEESLEALKRHGLRWDHVLFGLPHGERVLINDCKPSGLVTAFAVSLARDEGLARLRIELDETL
jgi:hypothetical protein